MTVGIKSDKNTFRLFLGEKNARTSSSGSSN